MSEASTVSPQAATSPQVPEPRAASGRARVPEAWFPALRRWFEHFAGDTNSVLERQLCTVSVYFLAQLVFLVPGVRAEEKVPVVAGAVVIIGATIGAVFLRVPRIPPRIAMAIPLADILAVGLLRAGTGGILSVFTIMLVLPVISLGVEPGRLPLLFGGVVTVGSILLSLFWVDAAQGADHWGPVVFTPAILGLACLSVNELASRLRSKVRVVQSLRRQQESLVVEAHRHTAASEAASSMAKDSTRQLINVIDSVTEQAIIATDSRGRVEVFNAGAQRMLRIAAHDVLGRSILQFHLPDELRQHRPEHAPAVGGFDSLVIGVHEGLPQVRDWTYITHDHENLQAQVTVTARRDSSGQNDGFLFVATDVTKDREQSRLKDDFVNLISHELRTPLSSILGYLELLTDDEDHPLSSEQGQFLQVIERNANRLLRLVSDLLFTAQVETGQFDLQGQDVDLRTVVASSMATAAPLAAARNLVLRTFVPEEDVTVLGDPVRLGQAVENLIANAVKFTAPGGRVAVSLTTVDAPEARALICVSDTGLGIPAEELDRLFSRFFRASAATDNAVPGVGLGLNITKAIVTAHGGRITVASTVGEGTTFAIELPFTPALATT